MAGSISCAAPHDLYNHVSPVQLRPSAPNERAITLMTGPALAMLAGRVTMRVAEPEPNSEVLDYGPPEYY